MHHIHAGSSVQFDMDGQTYTLRFTLRALKTLEHDHKISMLRGPENIVEGIRDPEKLALILYYGLKPNHPDITLDWVEDNFDAGMLVGLAPILGQAISGRKPTGDDPNGPAPGKPNGIGSLSGQLDDTISDSPTTSSGTSTLKN